MVAGIPNVAVGMGPSVPELHGSSYSAASAANFMSLDTIDLGSIDPSQVANREGIQQILNVQ
jgi:hypothetical protein